MEKEFETAGREARRGWRVYRGMFSIYGIAYVQ
jgi:hypothetical protein